MSETNAMMELLAYADVKVGTPVVVRSVNHGCGAGRLVHANSEGVVLRDAVHFRTWKDTGKNNGSIYDLVEAGTPVRDAELTMVMIPERCEIIAISEERYEDFRKAPRL